MNLRSGTKVFATTPTRIPDNPRSTRTIAISNASSPLLKLPGEVKNRIYEFTLGGHLIHLLQNTASNTHTHSDGIPLSHRICRATITEIEAQHNLDTADPNEKSTDPETGDEIGNVWNVVVNQDRHMECYPRTTQTNPTRRQYQVQLGLLRVCRQVWNECKAVPHSKNTFSFKCPAIMERFIRERVKHKQHSLIRSISLEVGLEHPNEQSDWASTLGGPLPKKLTRLNRLHIAFEQEFCLCWLSECEYYQVEENELYASIKKLANLPLKEATVVISDGYWLESLGLPQEDWELYEAESRWTLAEKQEFSTKMRKALLGRAEDAKSKGKLLLTIEK